MPKLAIELGEKFGRLMNYGDGHLRRSVRGRDVCRGVLRGRHGEEWSGQACGAFPKRASTRKWSATCSPGTRRTPTTGRRPGSGARTSTTRTWCTRTACAAGVGGENGFSIDAKLNGAYILMGLLYGKGDPDQTIIIATRCGQDSDCNPSNAGGVLFATIGFSNLPERFTSSLDPKGKFSHTLYDFPTLIDVSKKLVRDALHRGDGRVEKSANGEEVFVIPVVEPKPSELQAVYEAGPIAESKFTPEEMAKITSKPE